MGLAANLCVSPAFAQQPASRPAKTTPAAPANPPVGLIQKQTRIVSSKAPRVRIDNPYGDVRLRFGGYSSDMEVLSITQTLDGNLTLNISSDATADHLQVRPVEKDNSPAKSRIDLVVMVPKGKSVDVATTHGLVEAKGLTNDVNIRTTSGRIRLNKNKAAIQASSESGGIAAVLSKGVTEKEQVFASKTGSVEIWLAEDDKASVSMHTSGDLITHFSLTVERNPHEEPDKKATARINGGGHSVVLKSRRGNLAVRAYPASQ